MTEEEAQDWLSALFGRAELDRVRQFVDLVTVENARHNLVSPATIASIWSRHVADSAQLVTLGLAEGLWLDVGTGGGFPGMIVALLRDGPIMLVEPRRLRAQFLNECVAKFDLDERVAVRACRIERLAENASTISARAVGAAEKLLQAAGDCATIDTRWLLPRGKSVKNDLVLVETRWSGVFHVEQSITDIEAGILVLDRVQAR